METVSHKVDVMSHEGQKEAAQKTLVHEALGHAAEAQLGYRINNDNH